MINVKFNSMESLKNFWFIRKKVEILIRLMDSRLRPAGMTNKNTQLRLSSSGLTRGSKLFQLKYERPKLFNHVCLLLFPMLMLTKYHNLTF